MLCLGVYTNHTLILVFIYNILHLREANSEQRANKNWCVCLTHGESNKEWQSVRHNKVETEMRIEQMHTAQRIK